MGTKGNAERYIAFYIVDRRKNRHTHGAHVSLQSADKHVSKKLLLNKRSTRNVL